MSILFQLFQQKIFHFFFLHYWFQRVICKNFIVFHFVKLIQNNIFITKRIITSVYILTLA